jgi:hypothetical protein
VRKAGLAMLKRGKVALAGVGPASGLETAAGMADSLGGPAA